jgi:tRNA (cytidine32/guanosine34-2'-O)-methyltransferase
MVDNGIFLAKIFKGNDVKFLYSQFKLFFKLVYIVKPKSSRSSSVEAFIVCLNYNPPQNFVAKQLTTFAKEKNEQSNSLNEHKENKINIFEKKLEKFVTCGDLSGFDEDDG